MAWDVSSDVVDFDEAIEWFRQKRPQPDPGEPQDEFDRDWQAYQDELAAQAFKVAGVAQLDVVTGIYKAIDEALTSGTSLDEFKASVADDLESAWGGSVANPGARVETIFRTNVQSAYAAGRYAQMTDPDVLEDRPYWTYEGIEDDDECEICEPCDGTVLPADDPWWRSHQVPMHHQCRCEIHSLDEDEAKKRGIDTVGPEARAADGFGAPPQVDAWSPSAADYPPALWREFEKKTGTEDD